AGLDLEPDNSHCTPLHQCAGHLYHQSAARARRSEGSRSRERQGAVPFLNAALRPRLEKSERLSGELGGEGRNGATVDSGPPATENGSLRGLRSSAVKITAAVVRVRSAPFEIETLDLAAPLAEEVLVRIVASGICHTDLHARDGYFPNLPYPVVCGHEGAGIVERVGAAVADLAPGDSVVISFPSCGECRPCRAARIPYCERGRLLKSGGRRADGSVPMSRNGESVYSCFFQQSSFASFAVAPARDVVKIRRDAPIEMLGPLGCGLQTGAGAVL